MNFLVFDISANFAYFKVPEGTRSSYSFPFPPRTALIGLIAAMTGQSRNSYWNNEAYSEAKIAVQILKEPISYGIKMNYWRSKTVASIGGRSIGMKLMMGGSDVKNRGYTTQVKFDYLTDVKYRIFIHTSQDLLNDINFRLKNRRYYYPPYLGHANLLAEIEFIGEFEANSTTEGNYSTIIPHHTIDDSELGKYLKQGAFKLYNSVPNSYRTVDNHVSDELKSYISIPDGYVNVFVPDINKTLNLPLNEGYGYSLTIDGEEYDICAY